MKLLSVCLALCGLVHSMPTEGPKTIAGTNLTLEELNHNIANSPFLLNSAIGGFTRTLYESILRQDLDRSTNLILSPFSIHTALSMTFNGSPAESTTHQELARALGLNTADAGTYLYNYLRLLIYYDRIRHKYDTQVQFANKIYVGQGFSLKPTFQTVLNTFYLTSGEVVDFDQPEESLEIINAFVSNKTNGLIPDLLGPGSVDSLTRLILVNAIYYKAKWKYLFDGKQTRPMRFNLLNGAGEVVLKRGMVLEADLRMMEEEDGTSILELPYEDDNFSMFVFLPKTNTQEDLDKVVTALDVARIKNELLDRGRGAVRVRLPAIEAAFSTGLVSAMQGLGVNELFIEGKADLSDMSEQNDLSVSDVVHRAQVRVDEEGSEAAAATAVVVNIRTAPIHQRPTRNFVVDRPFVFVIVDKIHDIPLFVGRITNPGAQLQQEAPLQQQAPRQESLPDGVPPPTKQPCDDEEQQFDVSGDRERISFPCKGRDTTHIEEFEATKVERIQERRKRLSNSKTSRGL